MPDSEKVLICPACGEEMNKIYIEEIQCLIDICLDGCGGLFFDNREYKKVYGNESAIDQIKAALEGKNFKPVEPSKRTCPACGMKMITNKTSLDGSVIIDDCYGCGGKFLDYGELDKIKAEFKSENEHSEDVMKYLKNKMGEEYTEIQAYKLTSDKNKKPNLLNNIINKFL